MFDVQLRGFRLVSFRSGMYSRAMPRKRPIAQFEHTDKERLNNPPVGLVTAEAEPAQAAGKKTYAYDPHLDPALQWAGKAERTSFDLPTVALHVHERIDPRAIVGAVRRRNGSDYEQISLFHPAKNAPLREAIDFYRHRDGWSRIEGKRAPLFMFGIATRDKARLVTIILEHWLRANIDFDSLLVFQAQQEIPRADLARLSNVGGEMVASLDASDDFRRKVLKIAA